MTDNLSDLSAECFCERARGDLGCNCHDIVPPLKDRIDGFFREIEAALAALREAV